MNLIYLEGKKGRKANNSQFIETKSIPFPPLAGVRGWKKFPIQMKNQENFNYNKKLRPFAKANRNRMTKSEACMWKFVLSRRQMNGYQFRRQRPISSYIVDFVCLPLKLIIEMDGITHENILAIERDKTRDNSLRKLGFTTLRFSSWEVLNRIDEVSIIIVEWINPNNRVPPPNSRQRGKRKPHKEDNY